MDLPYKDLAEVRWEGEWYVLRAEPRGMPQSAWFLSKVVVLVSMLDRLLSNDRTWVVRIRTRANDPTGPVLYEETLSSRKESWERLQHLHDGIRRGDLPWSETP